MSILIIIALVIAVVFIIRKSRLKGKSIETQDLSGFKSEGYWNNFKRRQPQNAIEIEEICKRNMNSISDRDAFELVTSILRWSKNANTPICKLKEWFLQNLKKQDTDIPLAQYIEILKEEKLKEAKQFSISPDHTICNFMLEFLLEEEQEKNSDKELNRIASHLGLSEDFIEDVKNKCEESNIAPDISKLDREENKLFALANEGAEMLTIGISETNIILSNGAQIEARILCSTLVMELHSNFQNNIDMDKQADRYFLLLADQTMFNDRGSEIQDVISFINNRIAFYKEKIKESTLMRQLDIFKPDNALYYIYNTLFLNPLCDNPYNLSYNASLSNNLVMFHTQLEQVIRAMERGKQKILGNVSNKDELYRTTVIDLLKLMTPEEKRNLMNQDLAWLICDQTLSMIKNREVINELPLPLKKKIQEIINLESQLKLSEETRDDILEDVEESYIRQFKV